MKREIVSGCYLYRIYRLGESKWGHTTVSTGQIELSEAKHKEILN